VLADSGYTSHGGACFTCSDPATTELVPGGANPRLRLDVRAPEPEGGSWFRRSVLLPEALDALGRDHDPLRGFSVADLLQDLEQSAFAVPFDVVPNCG